MLLATLITLVAGLAVRPGPVSAQQAEPEAVVWAYYEALNSGDIATAASLWSPDIQVSSFGCLLALGRDCDGADEFFAVNEGASAGGFVSTPTEMTTVGATVHVETSWTSEALAGSGIDRVKQTDSYDLVDGLITRLVVTMDLSDQQTAAFADIVTQLVASAPASPAEVVAAYNSALNAADIDTLMTLISPEIQDSSWACDLAFGRDCVGAAEYRSLVAGAADSQIHETTLGSQVDGNTVTAYLELTFADLEGVPGVDRVRETVVFEVTDGLITREEVTLDLSDPQTAIFAEVLAQLIAQAQPPTPGSAGNGGEAGADHAWSMLFLALVGVGAARLAVRPGERSSRLS